VEVPGSSEGLGVTLVDYLRPDAYLEGSGAT
jgi:hypothetical protein